MICVLIILSFNPCRPTAEMIVSIIHSFEAEIANATPASIKEK